MRDRQIPHQSGRLSPSERWTTELPRPAEGLNDFFEKLWSHGITEAELATMAAANPARLLGL